MADGVGAGPAGTGDGVGAAAVGVSDSVGVGEAGESAGPLGVRSGHGRPIGTPPGSTPMSRLPMSSIPIQDKKFTRLYIQAIGAPISSHSETPRLAMLTAPRSIQSFIPTYRASTRNS